MTMSFTRPVIDENSKIDFYAGSVKAFYDLKPVWEAMPDERKGIFYTWEARPGTQVFGNYLHGSDPLVIANPADLTHVFYAGEERPFIFLEGNHFSHKGGLLVAVSLFLCSDDGDVKIRKALAQKYQFVEKISSAKQAVEKIIKFVIGVAPKYRDKIGNDKIGLMYVAFGEKATQAVKKSIATLKRVGFSYPVLVVGDVPVPGCLFERWEGESPFDATKKRNFQFRAGRIKPFLHDISPFDRTLYVDADVEFVEDIHQGFVALEKFDVVVTQEYLTVGELYNKFQAGWEINIQERNKTIEEGIHPGRQFINSGVVFFKKCKENSKLFKRWHSEWLRFQEWDEQLAFMRALHKTNSNYTEFPALWNDPHKHEDQTIIYHPYGRGSIRMSK
jgi:hypothetical protein